MILLSFWDPAEHLILLTEFLLLEKVQEEGWLHQVHTLDKHATKQKNKKIIIKKKRAILIRVISGMATLSIYHRCWTERRICVKKWVPIKSNPYWALNPFGRGTGWGTFLASSIPLPCPPHYSVDLLATTKMPQSDRTNHRYKKVKELKVTIPPPALASYLNSFLSEMICAWGR